MLTQPHYLITIRPRTAPAPRLHKRRAWYDSEPADAPPAEPAPTPDTSPGNSEGTPGATFTQADLDRIVGERAKRAKEAALGDFLKELGFEKPDDLKALVTSAKEAEAAKLSELEKAQQRIAQLEADAEKARAEAQQALQARMEERRNSAILTALKGAEKPQSVLNLLHAEHADDVAKVMSEDGTLDSKAIDALVKKAQAEYAGLFKPGAPGSGSHAGSNLPDHSKQFDSLGRASTLAAIKRGF